MAAWPRPVDGSRRLLCGRLAHGCAQLVKKKARGVSDVLRHATERAFSVRWWSLLAVALQRAIAEPVLRESGADLMPAEGSVELPLVDVLDACRA